MAEIETKLSHVPLLNIDLFLVCFSNRSNNETAAITAQILSVPWDVFGLVTFALSCTSIVVSLVYCRAIWTGKKRKIVRSKPYIFVAQRVTGDVTLNVAAVLKAALVLLRLHGMLEDKGTEKAIAKFLDLFFFVGLCGSIVAYCGLSWLKTLAIAAPLRYKTKVSSRRCLVIVGVGWAVTCVVVLAFLLASAVCSVSDVQKILACHSPYLLFGSFAIAAYCSVPVSFAVTVMALCFTRAQRQAAGLTTVPTQSISSLKLTLGVAIFSLGFLPLIARICFLVVATVQHGSVCHIFHRYFFYVIFEYAALWTVAVKSIADPVLELVIDRKLRAVLLQ